MLTLFFSLIMLSMISYGSSWSMMVYFLMCLFLYMTSYLYSGVVSVIYCSNNFYMDMLSVMLVLLTIWIMALMYLSSFRLVMELLGHKQFSLLLMILMSFLVFSFCFNKTLLFYIFFEASLFPTFLLILIWGYQPERIQASYYLIMYTVLASLPLLVNLMLLKNMYNHMNFMIPYVQDLLVKSWFYMAMWICVIMAFLVKLPLYMVHLWLPKAHVEAPVAGSMVLAAILLKLGGYGLIRMTYLLPFMNQYLQNVLVPAAMWGAVLASMICVRQSDMKSLIAYSSVGHMSVFLACFMSHSYLGMSGCLCMLIAHGFSSSVLFCLANSTYEGSMSRSLFLSKGVMKFSPLFSLFWFLGVMMNLGAPPFLNLPSELLLYGIILSYYKFLLILIMVILFVTMVYCMFLYSANNNGLSLLLSNVMNVLTLREMVLFFSHVMPSFLLVFMIMVFSM